MKIDEQYKKNDSKVIVVKKAWSMDHFPFVADKAPVELTAKGRQIPAWG